MKGSFEGVRHSQTGETKTSKLKYPKKPILSDFTRHASI